jgi:hypothetical protein
MAPPRDETQLWRRRSAVLAAAALIALVVVGIVIAGGGSGGSDSKTTPVAPLPETAGPRIENHAIGATIARPRRWTARTARNAIELRDPDGATAVSVSLPPRTDRSAAVLRAAVEGVRANYNDVRVRPGPAKEVGGRPAVSAVVSAKTRGGASINVLLSAVQGRSRAWLVQVVSGRDRRGGRGLVEAQLALGTLALRG